MTGFETGLEITLLVLLAVFAIAYVVQRARLYFSMRRAREVVAELTALETALVSNSLPTRFSAESTIAQLERLERKFTAESRQLLAWRSSETERWIVGEDIDALLVQYERAGAMTSRLRALFARRSLSA